MLSWKRMRKGIDCTKKNWSECEERLMRSKNVEGERKESAKGRRKMSVGKEKKRSAEGQRSRHSAEGQKKRSANGRTV